jgi:UDP-GlcNAc:undecaprenyl-phosphate/decaprenyl-phosphate GlcNAc-1-phosphate transferase
MNEGLIRRMSFPLNIYLAAFLSSGLVTALALPLWRRWSYAAGLVDDPGHRKIHHQPTSLAGGLAVLTGLLIPVLGAAIALFLNHSSAPGTTAGLAAPPPSFFDRDLAELLGRGLSRRAVQLGIVLLGGTGMVILGALDDRYELKPLAKFSGQLLIAAMVAAAGIRITLFVNSTLFSYAVTILWILTVINAFNFMDNMNGLCAGLGAIGAWFFAWSAAVQGQYLVAALAFLTSGGLLGFLPYNFPKATVFLGDAGSHLVGYLLAILAILPHFYSPETPNGWAVLRPLLILAVPLGDMGWVVIHRWRMGQPFYVGDTNHLSHRLVRCGLNRTQAVLAIWLIAIVLGMLSWI